MSVIRTFVLPILLMFTAPLVLATPVYFNSNSVHSHFAFQELSTLTLNIMARFPPQNHHYVLVGPSIAPLASMFTFYPSVTSQVAPHNLPINALNSWAYLHLHPNALKKVVVIGSDSTTHAISNVAQSILSVGRPLHITLLTSHGEGIKSNDEVTLLNAPRINSIMMEEGYNWAHPHSDQVDPYSVLWMAPSDGFIKMREHLRYLMISADRANTTPYPQLEKLKVHPVLHSERETEALAKSSYDDVSDIVTKLMTQFPPAEYAYVTLGASPTPIAAFIEAANLGEVFQVPMSSQREFRRIPESKMETVYKNLLEFWNHYVSTSKKLVVIDFVLHGGNLKGTRDTLSELGIDANYVAIGSFDRWPSILSFAYPIQIRSVIKSRFSNLDFKAFRAYSAYEPRDFYINSPKPPKRPAYSQLVAAYKRENELQKRQLKKRSCFRRIFDY